MISDGGFPINILNFSKYLTRAESFDKILALKAFERKAVGGGVLHRELSVGARQKEESVEFIP